MESIITELSSDKKLQRDNALSSLATLLKDWSDEQCITFMHLLISYLKEPCKWETKHGCLTALKLLIGSSAYQTNLDDLHPIAQLSVGFLSDTEVRVRTAAAELLGSLCCSFGTAVYEQFRVELLDLIRMHLQSHTAELDAGDDLIQKLIKSHEHDFDGGASATQMIHEFAGWRFLETGLKAIQFMIEGCGERFLPLIDKDIVDLLLKCLTHMNRFVREAAFFVCDALFLSSADVVRRYQALFDVEFVKTLSVGMGDDWSQVRLAASHATRHFLSNKSNDERELLYPILLGPMCLNRYCLAEGVRSYSQSTWLDVVGEAGKWLVAKYFSELTDFYISQSKSEHHSVRLAACHAIAELPLKIDRAVVVLQTQRLLDAVAKRFQDPSWPVRDAACVAAGNFICNFSDITRPLMTTFYPLFFGNLSDCIPPVRDGAAQTLAQVVRVYTDDVDSIILPKCREGLEQIRQQPQIDDCKFIDFSIGAPCANCKIPNFTIQSVEKRTAEDDCNVEVVDVRINDTTFTCDSHPLPAKDGCVQMTAGVEDKHSCAHESAVACAWEVTDGFAHFISELALSCPQLSSKLGQLLPLIAQACSHRSYSHHVLLLASICQLLPTIATRIGKRSFKPHLELFIEPIFYSLSCKVAITSTAAADCLKELCNCLGFEIMRSRVEMSHPEYLSKFDETVPKRSV